MNDIVRVTLLMYAQLPPEKEMAGGLLKAFESDPAFTPSHWGTSEHAGQPYSRKEIMAKASPSDSEPSAIFLHRRTVVKYRGYFDFARLPFLSLDFDGTFPAERWSEMLRLSDRVAAVLKPRLGVLHLFRPTVEPWVTERDRLVRWMTFAAYPIPVRFRRNGPLGVGMRTYFGHDILDMFGRELVLSSPALSQPCDWGGVRLDLTEEMLNTDQGVLAERWKKVMDHLRPSQAVPEPVFENDGRTVNFLPSRKWLDRRKMPNGGKAEA